MGCDIHAVWQAKKDGKWIDVESTWDQGRHYLLFSWLANVRNGYGFAGIPTYAPIKPITELRGLPNDFEYDEDRRMGDHSFSWLTADEILSAQRPGELQQTGVVTKAVYDAWDGKTPFESWVGHVLGGSTLVANSAAEIVPQTTHVRVNWKSDDGLDYFVGEVCRLKELHGEVRIVFGFDS